MASDVLVIMESPADVRILGKVYYLSLCMIETLSRLIDAAVSF